MYMLLIIEHYSKVANATEYNILAGIIRTGDDKIIDVLTTIFNSIWKIGKCPEHWHSH